MTFHGQNYSAHRLAFEIYKGSIPEGLYVLHTCDRPGCVNPDHLFTGTQADNMIDWADKNGKKKDPQEPRKKYEFGKNTSSIMGFRIRNDDKDRVERAATAAGKLPGEFIRIAVLNEVEFVENQ